jgi:hypothetical protein
MYKTVFVLSIYLGINIINMATIQSVNVLSAPSNYPGTAPTSASPSPVFGLAAATVQGVAVYSNTANPTGQSSVNIKWNVSAQVFTGTLICSQTAAAIISAS